VTIRRGAAWGATGALPAGALTARSDAEAAMLVEQARAAGRPAPVIRLVAGDLWRTCGGPSREDGAAAVALLPVDVGVVEIDGRERIFVANLVARGRTWWRGPVVAVCNAQYLGGWDAAPHSHPADGRLDVLQIGSMSLADRWKVGRRLATGTHVPHPAISERRLTGATFTFDRPQGLRLDGVPTGRAREVSVRVEPGALTVCV
jgi:hypothetical protein